MKKFICIMLVIAVCFTSVFAFDLTSVDDVKEMAGNYAQKIVAAIPAEISSDNIWADAYIGQLLAIPPHVAVGVNFGAGFIKDNALLSAIGDMTGFPWMSYLPGAPVPALSVNARVGGVILPFDVGVHGIIAGISPEWGSFKGNININTWGADFRYCLLKQKLIIPALSIGIGYDQIDTSAGILFGDTDIGCDFGITGKLVSGTAQASWKLLVIKLFAGARVIKPIEPITASAKVYKGDDEYLPTTFAYDSLTTQIFGGIGLRLLVLDTTIGALYDINAGSLGTTLSFRIQL